MSEVFDEHPRTLEQHRLITTRKKWLAAVKEAQYANDALASLHEHSTKREEELTALIIRLKQDLARKPVVNKIVELTAEVEQLEYILDYREQGALAQQELNEQNIKALKEEGDKWKTMSRKFEVKAKETARELQKNKEEVERLDEKLRGAKAEARFYEKKVVELTELLKSEKANNNKITPAIISNILFEVLGNCSIDEYRIVMFILEQANERAEAKK